MLISPQYVESNVTIRQIADLSGGGLLVRNIWYSLQGEGPFAGRPAVFIRLGGCNRGAKRDCTYCFPSTASLDTPSGIKRFRDIAKGDSLLTLNDQYLPDATLVKRVMRDLKNREDFVVVEILPEGSSTKKRLIVTREHPFHTTGRGFVEASMLRTSDEVFHIPGYERVAIHKASNNPMKNAATASKVSKSLRQQYANGSLLSYERSASVRAALAAHMRKSNPMYNSASVAKMVGSKVYPKSGLETFVESTLREVSAQVRYTGDNSYPIGDNESGYLYPDFVIGGNKVVEVYDPTYPKYAERRHTAAGAKRYEADRTAHYAKFGYRTLFVKCGKNGLRRSNNNYVAAPAHYEYLSTFLKNGARVLAVRPISTIEWNTLLRKQKDQFGINGDKVEVTNFSCAPYNTFTVEGVHVHNCDTDFRISKSTVLSIEEIREKVVSLSPTGWQAGARLVVITGGEPFLHDVDPLVENLIAAGYIVQFESNGDLVREDSAPGSAIVVSPKIVAATGRYARPPVGMLERADFLKILVSADANNPYHQLPDYLSDFSKSKGPGCIFISPINEYARPLVDEELASMWSGVYDHEKCAKNNAYAAQLVMQHGYRLSLQMHTYVAVP